MLILCFEIPRAQQPHMPSDAIKGYYHMAGMRPYNKKNDNKITTNHIKQSKIKQTLYN